MNSEEQMADLFRAMALPVRLQMLLMIGSEEVCVCQMIAALDKRQAYISQQLMVLREAGLVEAAKSGRRNYYRLARPELIDIIQAAADYLGVTMPIISVPPVECCSPISKIEPTSKQ